jgi:4-hydroxyphenylpyruvate dioxygenase
MRSIVTTSINQDNPLGIISIDHLEFTSDTLNSPTKDLFYKLGFEKTFINQGEHSELYSQGQIRFLLNSNPNKNSHSRNYYENHGEGVSKISFLVENAELAFKEIKNRSAEVIMELDTVNSEFGEYKFFQIKGVGDIVNEIIQRPTGYFRPNFEKVEKDEIADPLINRVSRIDHLTNNVPRGEMEKWVDFYKNTFGFVVTRYFDIKGKKTGLFSKVVQLKNGSVMIPINEPDKSKSKSQIQEFLDQHRGPGVQHIALSSGDVLSTVGDLKERGIKFLEIPTTYFEDLPNRNFKIKEKIKDLEHLAILADGDEDGYLLQIFTEPYIGPLFFEFIQRKKHFGFGEGNFQALFDAMERDQRKRGYLK